MSQESDKTLVVKVYGATYAKEPLPQALLKRAIEVGGSVAWVEDHGHEGWQVWEPSEFASY